VVNGSSVNNGKYFHRDNEESISVTATEGKYGVMKIGNFEIRALKWSDFGGQV
jgi:hypothetical protein